MARHLYPGVLVELATTGAPAPNLPVTVWTDLTSGTNVTSLLVGPDGVSPFSPQTDAQGNLKSFRGPDGYVGSLFVDSGVGQRYLLVSPTVIDTLISALGSLGVTVHGALSGLDADDHLQYLTTARGDARYYPQATTDSRISTAVGTASTADRQRSNHTGQQTASTISDFATAVAAAAPSQSGVPPVDVQVFTTSGTWTKPAGAKKVEVVLVGGGGGGGSGRRGAAASVRCGGGGGAGGGISVWTFSAADLNATHTVTVGTGGPGGAARTTDSTDGATGSTGFATIFQDRLQAGYGNPGSGGTASSGAAGSAAQYALYNGQPGGAASVIGSTGGTPAVVTTMCGALGGGAGGGLNASDATAAGGASGSRFSTAVQMGAGAAAGGAAGLSNPGQPGTAGGAYVNGWLPGLGGSGGGSGSNAYKGGDGGAGGTYGGGGGGGGASFNGSLPGAGGRGGDGIAVITTYF